MITAKRARYFIVVLLLLVEALPAAGTARESAALPDSLLGLFEYERGGRVDLEITGSETVAGVAIRQCHFASPVDGRVTAALVEPARRSAGERGRPGIIFMHWGQGDHSEFVSEAILYARSGAVSILLDAPFVRPEPWAKTGEMIDPPEPVRDMYIQNIKDIRRAVDLLVERGDVDPARIAYVGHSFGATWGGVLAAVEKRIKTHILMGGLPSLVDLSLEGAPRYDRFIDYMRNQVDTAAWVRFVELMKPIMSVGFVGFSAPSSIFFQFAIYDSWISTRAAAVYYEAASEPKRIEWYHTSHEFMDVSALLDRARWLEREIGLGPVTLR